MSGVPSSLTFLSVAVALTLCHGTFAQSCGGELSLPPDSSVDVWSPGYPSPYDAGAQCLWKLQSPEGYKIAFKCSNFDLQMSSYCSKDSLSISPSGDIGLSDGYAYCGQSPSPDIVSTGRNLVLVFRSDFYYSGTGFHCTASSVPESSLPAVAPKTRSSLTTEDASCQCGMKGAATKIVGGAETGVHEYPWQASIQSTKGESFCGGTVIDKEWILTAAHCLDDVNPAEIRVVLGDHDLNSTSETSSSASFAVDNVIKHESYDSTTVANDIALIHLTQPIAEYSDAIRPVCLPWGSKETYENKDATITGWGKTSNDGQTSPTLQDVTLPILANTDCVSKIGAEFFNKDQNICAAAPGKDSCDGDSGGPLQLQNSTDGRTYQVGIVSWGVSCDDPQYPAVYTRVSNYLDWIKEKAASAEFCTPPDPAATTAAPTTAVTTAPAPTTAAVTTAPAPTTAAVTTAPAPTTAAVTTAPAPTTAAVTTAPAPTTAAVTTAAAPTTAAVTTAPAQKAASVTSAPAPTTAAVTTAAAPTTAAVTTAAAPTTAAVTTAAAPTTAAVTTAAAPTTAAASTTIASSLKDVCGQSKAARIAGGTEATPHQYPWNILILNKTDVGYESVCGGSIINEEWILTAAKCVSGKATNNLQVDIGEHDVTTTSDGPRMQVVVDRVITHEQFNAPTVMNNDIALLHLAKPVTFSDTVRPVCLPFSLASNTFVGSSGVVAGWGKTSMASATKSPVLNKVSMNVIENDTCRTSGFGKYMTPNMICIKGTAGQGTCTGDGGAPFVFNNPGDSRFYQIGIESFGLKSTCDSGGPFAYERVTSHLSWITQNTGIAY